MNMRELTIIGGGSLGSFFLTTVFLCGKMATALGFRRIYIYDFDKVEAHNLLNQAYRPKDIGRYKVDAIREIVQPFSEAKIIAKRKEVNYATSLSGVVVILVDNMGARKEIFELCQYRADIPYYIDARTGLDEAYVAAFDPRDPDCVDRYKKTLYSQEEGVPAPCANPRSVPTCVAVSSIIQECLLRFRKKQKSVSLADKVAPFIAATVGKILVRFKTQKVYDTGEFLETVISLRDLPYVQTRQLKT